MDTTTDTPATDIVVVDAEIVEDESGFGSEIAKNAAVSAATVGVVVVGVLAFNHLKPRVASLIARIKKTETPAPAETPVEVTPEETPKTD